MAETVDVVVKNDLVRAHVVSLKDSDESVVLRVDVLGVFVREGRGVSQQQGQLWLQTRESPAWVNAKTRGVFERENLMILCYTFSSMRA